MSPRRILIGLLVTGAFLAAELVAYWYFYFPEKWIPLVLMIVVTGAGGFLSLGPRAVLRPYWDRPCMGIRWRRRFPDAPKTEIREFLNLFTDAFAFRRKRRCCFSPDDRVIDVYRALYPPGSQVDALEFETFSMMLKEQYGIDFATFWREDITLGEIYARVHQLD